ncbi:putative adhesin P123 [Spiroplasma phoeniceum P40]|uniref:Adhesin P123 n=2 Tax=Spiroplasma phoeniceum TaxID=47835 RepID=A0A345DQ43_9MOLU|nr:putative adhesin P123 [Spiroplasma phoeniceum P40]
MNSRDLLMYNMYPAPPDKINTYASPEVSWYDIQGIQPTIITGYKDWKEHIQSMSDFWIEKNNEGMIMIITDKTTSTATNPTVGTTISEEGANSKPYWSKSWKITPPNKVKVNSGTINNIISTQASSYFRRKDEFGNTIGQVQIEYNKMGLCNIWDILNMNNFINRQITTLPLNYTQKLVFNPFTIPAIGKFLNFVSFGIPWDWIGNLTITQDDKWPNFPWLNGFMSANVYSFYNDAFWGDKSATAGYLPFEIFREQGNDKIGALIGVNATSNVFIKNRNWWFNYWCCTYWFKCSYC